MILFINTVLKIAASNIKFRNILTSSSLSDVRIYIRDGPFKKDIGIVNLHPFPGSDCVLYIHEKFFDSCSSAPPQKTTKINIKRNGHSLFSENKIQGLTRRYSYCAGYNLYVIYWTRVIGIDFKSNVLNLCYQMIQ